jgi:hypothetical protein
VVRCKRIDVFEEHVAFIFKFEEKATHKTGAARCSSISILMSACHEIAGLLLSLFPSLDNLTVLYNSIAKNKLEHACVAWNFLTNTCCKEGKRG